MLGALVLATLRGLAAPGYMLSPSQTGAFEITVCTGSGSRTILLSADDFRPLDTPHTPAHDGDDGSCPFAAASQAQLPAASSAFFAQTTPARASPSFVHAETSRTASAFLWPFANAPPVTTH